MSPQVRFVELVKAIAAGYPVDIDYLDCLDCAMLVPEVSIPEIGPMMRFAASFVYSFATERYEETHPLVSSHIRRWKEPK